MSERGPCLHKVWLDDSGRPHCDCDNRRPEREKLLMAVVEAARHIAVTSPIFLWENLRQAIHALDSVKETP